MSETLRVYSEIPLAEGENEGVFYKVFASNFPSGNYSLVCCGYGYQEIYIQC
jgi:hypothetical protein